MHKPPRHIHAQAKRLTSVCSFGRAWCDPHPRVFTCKHTETAYLRLCLCANVLVCRDRYDALGHGVLCTVGHPAALHMASCYRGFGDSATHPSLPPALGPSRDPYTARSSPRACRSPDSSLRYTIHSVPPPLKCTAQSHGPGLVSVSALSASLYSAAHLLAQDGVQPKQVLALLVRHVRMAIVGRAQGFKPATRVATIKTARARMPGVPLPREWTEQQAHLAATMPGAKRASAAASEVLAPNGRKPDQRSSVAAATADSAAAFMDAASLPVRPPCASRCPPPRPHVLAPSLRVTHMRPYWTAWKPQHSPRCSEKADAIRTFPGCARSRCPKSHRQAELCVPAR